MIVLAIDKPKTKLRRCGNIPERDPRRQKSLSTEDSTKTCKRCGATKPLTEFHIRRASKDGLAFKCKPCANSLANISKAKNRAHYNEQERQRRLRNPIEHKRRKAWNIQQRRKDPEALARMRMTRRLNEQKRRARGHGILPEDRLFVAALVRDPCSYCGGISGTLDHIVPLANGGEHGAANFTAACRTCNSSKHAKSLLEFLLTRR